jgi:hypothetical protein
MFALRHRRACPRLLPVDIADEIAKRLVVGPLVRREAPMRTISMLTLLSGHSADVPRLGRAWDGSCRIEGRPISGSIGMGDRDRRNAHSQSASARRRKLTRRQRMVLWPAVSLDSFTENRPRCGWRPQQETPLRQEFGTRGRWRSRSGMCLPCWQQSMTALEPRLPMTEPLPVSPAQPLVLHRDRSVVLSDC